MGISTRKSILDIDKTSLVDPELIDKITLWILRIILKCGGHRKFIDKDNDFYDEQLAHFLDVGKFIQMEKDTFKKKDVLDILEETYIKLEKKKKFTTSKILQKNINQLSNLMDLNQTEKEILEFFVLAHQYEILEDAIELMGNNLNTTQAKKMLSIILSIDRKTLEDAFKSTSKLIKSSIISIQKHNTLSISNKIEIINSDFADNMLNMDEDISVILKDSIRICAKSDLNLKDYEHLSKDLKILIPYIKNAIKTKKEGVNILFYGHPGTGKTELAKVIASHIKTELFEISYADEDEEPIDGYKRLKAYKTAQALLKNKNILLMYDEAEDIFDSEDNLFGKKRQENKAWLNRILETNTIPTVWITNDIYSIDNALVRRFDFSLEIPIPNKSKRVEIIKSYSNNILEKKDIELLAENEHIAPALITRTTKVLNSINVADKSKAFRQILNNTLKAQGYDEIKEKPSSIGLPNNYNPSYINSSIDLEALTQGIKKSKDARLCLYGPAGTGKSAFGKYIAKSLKKPLILKKGSDLINMYVGGTEKNIANAFEEAREEKAVLVFDEVDSFLADRRGANRSWEVTQVNEMLVQMENFEGIFIATTNLMENLDQASLRRFDLKLEFGYLKPEQSWKIFTSYVKELKLSKPNSTYKKIVEDLGCLTPGDFAAVARQHRFNPIVNIKDFINRLQNEIEIKNDSNEKILGFTL